MSGAERGKECYRFPFVRLHSSFGLSRPGPGPAQPPRATFPVLEDVNRAKLCTSRGGDLPLARQLRGSGSSSLLRPSPS